MSVQALASITRGPASKIKFTVLRNSLRLLFLLLLIVIIIITLHVRLDLELSKVDEDLLKISASELEVFDHTATDKVSKVAEHIAEKNAASINVDTLNAVSDLDHLLRARFLSKQLLRPD